MKKSNKRLLLNKENVRVLSGAQLDAVAGGFVTMACDDNASALPPCADDNSASKAPTGMC